MPTKAMLREMLGPVEVPQSYVYVFKVTNEDTQAVRQEIATAEDERTAQDKVLAVLLDGDSAELQTSTDPNTGKQYHPEAKPAQESKGVDASEGDVSSSYAPTQETDRADKASKSVDRQTRKKVRRQRL